MSDPYINYSAQEKGEMGDFDGMYENPYSDEEETVINTREFTYTTGIITTDILEATFSWSWSSTHLKEGTHIEISLEDIELHVSYIDNYNIFQMEHVKYMTEDQGYESFQDENSGWESLPEPEESPEFIEMFEDDKDYVSGTIDVSVDGEDEEGNSVSESNTFYVYVFSNYNSTKEKYAEEIDKRRGIHASLP